ncbi:hypothetical protein VNO78_21440 [Psophocarpus tetragonolobus]|uniref:Leucine-rich repeat-containing N-terminal plant-type domain-containing protein n=1 Tax=Psophocarpus tetragonolobus TaxID=3891 RepID=A0AAN9SDB4_PSOTE
MFSQISIVLLLLLCANTFHRRTCGTNLQLLCNENDRFALQIFKLGVGNHSNMLPSWSTEQDCCVWKGVHCDNTTGRVTRLDLHQQHLEVELRLESCHLTNISPSIKYVNFSSLSTLDLSGNHFFTELPYWLLNITTISHIDLSFNLLQGPIPKSLLSLRNLVFLKLNNNEISGSIPEWLGQHEQLQYLGLSENVFNGSIPSSIGNLSSLVDLSIRGLPHISENVLLLDLSDNSFSGPISPFFCHKLGRETSLDYLDISSNLFTGEVPDCWEYWKGLSFLFMQNNKLTGEVPQSMASFVDIIILNLSNNCLSGNFSLDLSNLKNLEYINLKRNNLSGAVPTRMPSGMEVMLLGSNQFEGNIPPQLSWQEHKEQFTIHFRSIWYTKGQELEYRDYGLLRTLDLSCNNLSGEIPPQVFSLDQLQTLNSSRNHLTGKMSREIGSMKNLESLDLSSNKLYGEIPTSISSLSFLSFLNLSNNDFTGQIPIGTQLQTFSASSYAGNPKLCGAPLPKNCTEASAIADGSKQNGGSNDEAFQIESLYLGIGVGFVVGFWGLWGSLFLNRTWRHTYIRFLNHVVDQIHVFVVVKWNSLKGTQ